MALRDGLAGGVWHPDPIVAYDIAGRIRAGTVTVNGGGFGSDEPSGGSNQAGVGREQSDSGLLEHLPLGTVQSGGAQQ